MIRNFPFCNISNNNSNNNNNNNLNSPQNNKPINLLIKKVTSK